MVLFGVTLEDLGMVLEVWFFGGDFGGLWGGREALRCGGTPGVRPQSDRWGRCGLAAALGLQTGSCLWQRCWLLAALGAQTGSALWRRRRRAAIGRRWR